MTVRERIKQLAEQFPEYKYIYVEYYGSGDEFGDFNNTYGKKGENDRTDYNLNLDPLDIEDLLDMTLQNSDANFNNEGSEGTITINLLEGTVEVENYHRVEVKELGDGGSLTGEEDMGD